jgi:hypothetical protein
MASDLKVQKIIALVQAHPHEAINLQISFGPITLYRFKITKYQLLLKFMVISIPWSIILQTCL